MYVMIPAFKRATVLKIIINNLEVFTMVYKYEEQSFY